jgi:hypothetical protein
MSRSRTPRPIVVALAAGWMAWMLSVPAAAQTITLATSAGGVTIGGVNPSWSTGFGSVNGLGLGTPVSGATVLSATNGVLYTTPYSIVVSGTASNNKAKVNAYVSSNFAAPSALVLYSCTSGCGSAANYAPISTSSGSPTDIIGSPGIGSDQTVTRWLGLFVSSQNGAGAFTGSASATITFRTVSKNAVSDTDTLAFNNPVQQVQTALRLTLRTAAGGRTVSTAADFALDYGTVNGLGIAPATGLTVSAATGGVVYSTPYLLQPSFAGFSSTTGTLQAYVSLDFIHPSQLELRDSPNGTAFAALSKAAGAPTTLTTGAASGTTVTHYLGLFVSSSNGAGIFTGSDSAAVTFTLVVP